MDKEVDIPALFERLGLLPWDEFAAQCDTISPEAALAMWGAVMDYYSALPDDKRFFVHSRHRTLKSIRIGSWSDWREHMGMRCAEFYSVRRSTAFVQEIARKAGPRYWLAWLNSLSNHAETVSIILESRPQRKDLIHALGLSCGMEDMESIRTILFCFLISENLTEADLTSFSEVVRKNSVCLRALCLEVLCDFTYLVRYPRNAEVYDSIAAIWTGGEALEYLSASAEVTIGTLAAWAKLLSGREPSQEQLKRFKTAYLSWVSSTCDYVFLKDIKGKYLKHEGDFLNTLIKVFALDDSSEEELKALWEKKTYVYYSWNRQTYRTRQWFQHIGLLLWYMGVVKYERCQDTGLMIYVLERMNLVIPMTLSESDYTLLLGNVFCASVQMVPEINALLINLIHKVHEISLICDITRCYLDNPFSDPDVLCALQARLRLFSKLPQKKEFSGNTAAMEKLLLETEDRLSKKIP